MEQNNKVRPLILVAEDDPDDRLLVTKALEEAGFTGNLQFVRNGVELMTYLQDSKRKESGGDCPRPDLLLLDLNMPRKNGREVLEDIKRDPECHDISVVVLTGSELQDEAELSRKLGVNHVLLKPDSYPKWVQMMDRVLRLVPQSK